jgi:hypothetical protein
MAELIFASIPAPLDLLDSTFDQGRPLGDNAMKRLNQMAKFGAVRCEIIYVGFFVNGNIVPAPISPVDGYAYSKNEVIYVWALSSNRAPADGFTPGQKALPGQADLQAGGLYNYPGTIDINDLTGLVSIAGSYWKTAQTGGMPPWAGLLWTVIDTSHGYLAELPTTDGILKVWAICQRLSVNQIN